MVTPPALEVIDVTVYRGALRVVDSVSFELEYGKYLGLLGLNGAGKTSLLSALAGILPLASGTVRLDGREIVSAKSWQRSKSGLGLVPAGRQLFPKLSVRDNLLVGGHLMPRRQRGTALAEVCDLFPALRDKLDQRARELSGGQQQMVAIGRALMARPRVLLLDEPSEGLAPIVVDQVFAAIARLRDRGELAIVLAEQNAGAAALCDATLLMQSGRATPISGDGRSTDAVARAVFSE